DHLHFWPDRFDVPRDARDETASPDGHEDRRHAVLSVTENLVANRALSGDDERIVERMNEGHPSFSDESVAVRLRVGVTVADEHDLRAHRTHRIHLDLRRRLRHDNDRM